MEKFVQKIYKMKDLFKFNLNKNLKVLILVLIFLSIFYFVLGESFFAEKELNEKKPNLILISIDSLGANHIFCYGYSRNTTPNLDNFASQGILFKSHISQSYLTPISEMSVHTGMYPSSSGFVGFDIVLSEKIMTLAEILKIYNYRTAAFGNSPEFLFPAISSSFSRGYDTYNFLNTPIGNAINLPRDFRGHFIDQKKIFDFIQRDDEPFFIWVALGSAHFPYGKSERNFREENYTGILKDKALDWHDGVFPWIYNNTLYEIDEKGNIVPIKLNKEDIQFIIDSYDDDVLATDKWLGEFLKNFNKTGLEKNTIIIIQSEHGEELGKHGYISHYDIFDDTIKTFLIIKNPLIKEELKVINKQSQGIDILPTILDFLNISISHNIQGNSLLDLIYNKSQTEEKYVFVERTPLWERTMFQGCLFDKNVTLPVKTYLCPTAEIQSHFYDTEIVKYIQGNSFYNERDFAIRTNEWKLIYRKSKNFQENYSWWNVLINKTIEVDEFELYNLKSDPLEQKNVIDAYPNISNNLKQKLFEILNEVDNSNKTKFEIQRTIQEYF